MNDKKTKTTKEKQQLEEELERLRRRPLLAITCNGSFPASDPPSYWASRPEPDKREVPEPDDVS